MTQNLNLHNRIVEHLDTAVTKGDGQEDADIYGELYMAMKKQIAKLNAAVESADNIDPEVPKDRRTERQRLMVLEAKGQYESAMVAPLAALETKLAAKERRISEEANKPSSVDPVVGEMRAAETRKLLLGMPETERVKILMDAAKQGKKDCLDAVKASLLPILPDEIMERVNNKYLDTHVPTLNMIRNQNRERLLQAEERVNRVSRGLLRAFSFPLSAQLPKKQPA